MDRRAFVTGLGALLAAPLAVEAQAEADRAGIKRGRSLGFQIRSVGAPT